MQDMLELIAAQQRELNSTFREFGERLASVETNVTILCGNGQPGRITILEQRVDDLRRWRWRVVGIATGVATVMSGIVTTLAWMFKN